MQFYSFWKGYPKLLYFLHHAFTKSLNINLNTLEDLHKLRTATDKNNEKTH